MVRLLMLGKLLEEAWLAGSVWRLEGEDNWGWFRSCWCLLAQGLITRDTSCVVGDEEQMRGPCCLRARHACMEKEGPNRTRCCCARAALPRGWIADLGCADWA